MYLNSVPFNFGPSAVTDSFLCFHLSTAKTDWNFHKSFSNIVIKAKKEKERKERKINRLPKSGSTSGGGSHLSILSFLLDIVPSWWSRSREGERFPLGRPGFPLPFPTSRNRAFSYVLTGKTWSGVLGEGPAALRHTCSRKEAPAECGGVGLGVSGSGLHFWHCAAH